LPKGLGDVAASPYKLLSELIVVSLGEYNIYRAI
jgi:hypothetical protein